MVTTQHTSALATCIAIVDVQSDIPNEHCIYALKSDAIHDDYGEYIYGRPTMEANEQTQILDVWLVNKENQVHPGYCHSGVPVSKTNLVMPAAYVVIPFDEF